MTSQTYDGWQPGTLMWVERKRDGAVYEVIYELASDPDLLRQASVHERHLDLDARRREPILVHEQEGETRIRRVTAVGEV